MTIVQWFRSNYLLQIRILLLRDVIAMSQRWRWQHCVATECRSLLLIVMAVVESGKKAFSLYSPAFAIFYRLTWLINEMCVHPKTCYEWDCLQQCFCQSQSATMLCYGFSIRQACVWQWWLDLFPTSCTVLLNLDSFATLVAPNLLKRKLPSHCSVHLTPQFKLQPVRVAQQRSRWFVA